MSVMVASVASPATLKAIKRVMPAQHPHWVGSGFHVFPVFADLAFTKELSPWLVHLQACLRQRALSPRAPSERTDD